MRPMKKTTAQWALRGIGVLSILLGLAFPLPAVALVLSFWRDDQVELFMAVIYGVFFLIGICLLHGSIRMLRGKSFTVTKPIAGFLALYFFGWVEPWSEHIAATFANEGIARMLRDTLALAAFLSMIPIYLLSRKLMKKLVEAGYGPRQCADEGHDHLLGSDAMNGQGDTASS